MNDLNLLDIRPEHSLSPAPKRTRRGKIGVLKITGYLMAISVIVLFVFTSRIIVSQDNSITGVWSFFNQIKHLAQTSENMLKGETDDRVNILLLGMGGQNHEGGYLTDTIMLASLQPSTGDIAMISIPRDLLVPVEGYGWQKINYINAYAETDESGRGGPAPSPRT